VKLTVALAFSIFLLTGCEPVKKEVVVINKNKFFQCEPSQVIKKKMVRLINRTRSSGRRCGIKDFPAADPVKWNSKLEKAALNHSRDMAQSDFLSHTGSNRSSVSKRVKKFGYTWMSIGENIYAGRERCEDVISGWLNSSSHCKNIMDSSFTEIGAACFRNASSKYGTYWTLVFGSALK
jgi:uncharacterized protein YkwD